MYLIGQRSASNLGAYRGPYALRGLSDDAINVAVDPTMLYAGLGLLAVAALLFTGRKARQEVGQYREFRRKRKKQRQLAGAGF